MLGAVILFATTGSFAPMSSDLWRVVILLYLPAFFFMYGPGPLPIDGALSKRKSEPQRDPLAS